MFPPPQSIVDDSPRAHPRTRSGRILLQIVIDRDGQVGSLKVIDSTVDHELLPGIAKAIWLWQFPKPVGGGSVTATMSLGFDVGATADPGLPFLSEPQSAPSTLLSSKWDLALAILQKPADLKDRVAQAAAVVCAPDTDSPAVLAWWIVDACLRAFPHPTAAYLLAAGLLREAGLSWDASRVLSEAASESPATMAKEHRHWPSSADLARLRELTARK
jgi:hypothetical protein